MFSSNLVTLTILALVVNVSTRPVDLGQDPSALTSALRTHTESVTSMAVASSMPSTPSTLSSTILPSSTTLPSVDSSSHISTTDTILTTPSNIAVPSTLSDTTASLPTVAQPAVPTAPATLPFEHDHYTNPEDPSFPDNCRMFEPPSTDDAAPLPGGMVDDPRQTPYGNPYYACTPTQIPGGAAMTGRVPSATDAVPSAVTTAIVAAAIETPAALTTMETSATVSATSVPSISTPIIATPAVNDPTISHTESLASSASMVVPSVPFTLSGPATPPALSTPSAPAVPNASRI
ncbi:hypothetical protein C8Q80DRAFT_433760 [Daedaleopsis nitida]|nr:hypothetical protein C8Q80DRAFT_433760 [Daedaleopsis nitida]